MSLRDQVLSIMKDGQFHSLSELNQKIPGSKDSIAAAMRTLRRTEYGGYNVERRRGWPDWTYRIQNISPRKTVPSKTNGKSFLENYKPVTVAPQPRNRYTAIVSAKAADNAARGCQHLLKRLQEGCSGLLLATNWLEFQRVVWPAFVGQCNKNTVEVDYAYRFKDNWVPGNSFRIRFKSGGDLIGAVVDDPKILMGIQANCAFAHQVFDRSYTKSDELIKVLMARLRVVGRNGEQPYLWFSSKLDQYPKDFTMPDNTVPHVELLTSC